MASKNVLVSARVDPEVKKEAEAILDALGISVSAAINSLYRQIIMQRGLPYRLIVPYEPRDGSGLTPETRMEQDKTAAPAAENIRGLPEAGDERREPPKPAAGQGFHGPNAQKSSLVRKNGVDNFSLMRYNFFVRMVGKIEAETILICFFFCP